MSVAGFQTFDVDVIGCMQLDVQRRLSIHGVSIDRVRCENSSVTSETGGYARRRLVIFTSEEEFIRSPVNAWYAIVNAQLRFFVAGPCRYQPRSLLIDILSSNSHHFDFFQAQNVSKNQNFAYLSYEFAKKN